MLLDIEVATVKDGADAGLGSDEHTDAPSDPKFGPDGDGPGAAARSGLVVVVRLAGELDVSSAPRLRQELVRTVAESEGPPRIVVDLRGVDFLDSTGLGVLLGAVKRVRGQGGALALCRAEPQVRKVFEVTRVIEILALHDDVASAVASVRAQ